MQNDDVRDQLEALRSEVRALSNAFVGLRQEDVRKSFGDQIRPILLERIDRFVFRSKESHLWGVGDQAECKERLVKLVDDAISIYEQGGKEEVTQFLDGYESDQGHKVKTADHPDLASFVLDLIKELRDYFETSETILNRSEPSGRLIGSPADIKKTTLSPIQVEKALGPLSNALRIKVMMRLSEDDDSLAELSKALGLKKGHLQFHLKSLLDSGYIKYSRKSHLYSVTAKGAVALDGVAKLIERLASI